MGGDLKKRKGNGGIMGHDVASTTQTVKSEKRGGGGGGKEESRVKWTRETDLGGAQFMFLP